MRFGDRMPGVIKSAGLALSLLCTSFMMGTQNRVLVVENDVDQAFMIERWLTRTSDSVVTTAFDGTTGQNLARSGDFDALVSDVCLPGANGFAVVRAYKESHRHRPAFLMTANSNLEVMAEAVRSSADDLLPKPLDFRHLVTKIDQHITHSRTDAHRPQKTILAIGAHPDDVEIGCGGTLLSHVASGDRVVVATLSRGARGGCAATRENEAMAAAAQIGAELILEDLPDTMMTDGPETIGALTRIIRSVQPSVIYTHCSKDLHQDHRAVHRATMVAGREIPNVFCYQSPSTTPEFMPTLFMPVKSYIDAKIALLDVYQSQTGIRPYLTDAAIRSSAQYWGRFAGYVDVEPFVVVRQSSFCD